MPVKKKKTSIKPVKNDFLLEIGTEEIPSGFIDPALSQLKEKTGQLLAEQRLDFNDITTMATPRRFVLLIKGLALKQKKILKLNGALRNQPPLMVMVNLPRFIKGSRKAREQKKARSS